MAMAAAAAEHQRQPRKPKTRLKPGIDVMLLKIFSPKSSAKKLAFLTENKAKFK
jgi:hypothetical protein